MTAIPPNRLRIEAGLGYSLLNWQWCAMLAILGFPAEEQVQRDRPVSPRTLDPEQPPAEPVAAPTLAAAPNPRRDDDKDRTCEICGRIGVRRFIQTPTGWKCSPSATRCIGNQPEPVRKIPNPALYPDLDEPAECNKVGGISTPNVALPDRSGIDETPSDISAKPFPADVTPEPKLPDAYCQDCTRTWVIGPRLTRRMLDAAVEMHELKRGHVVTVIGGEDD